MNYDKCFFDNEIKVRFLNFDENIEDYNATNPNESYKDYSDYYHLIYLNGRESKVIIDNKIHTYHEPLLIIIGPKTDLKWYCSKQPFYQIRMHLHPNLFRNIKDNGDVLEFFYKLENEQNIIKLNLPQFSSLKNYIDSIQTALFARCGRFTMESRINALISELNLIYETNYKEYVATTDSIPAQIVDYVERHYLEKITLKDMSEKFFVSVNTINAIFKKMTGKTFKQYVLFLRLTMANKFIAAGNEYISNIAKISGFSDYSSFLKAYKKEFGTLPSKKMGKKIKRYPLIK